MKIFNESHMRYFCKLCGVNTLILTLFVTLLHAKSSLAQAPPTTLTPQVQQPQMPTAPTAPADGAIEELLVVGEQPGPGMWRVTKGENTLWILGTYEPVPQKMKWRAKNVREIIAKSQEILSPPSTRISAKQIGFFNTLTLIPAAMDSRKNPDGQTLKDIVPADVYQRWLVLRDKYIDENNTNDEDKDIERWRPIFAARELYRKAISKSGLTTASPVWPVVRDNAKLNKVTIKELLYEPKVTNARGALKAFSKVSLADITCFTMTIERIETDLAAMRVRANAWSTGDIDRLTIAPEINQREACRAAVLETTAAKLLGVKDIAAKLEALWIDAAEIALAKNKVTLAVLPFDRLIGANNYLDKLKRKGYLVEAPDN